MVAHSTLLIRNTERKILDLAPGSSLTGGCVKNFNSPSMFLYYQQNFKNKKIKMLTIRLKNIPVNSRENVDFIKGTGKHAEI